MLRVWLPDRPGALGAVASRIGAVKGDVVGIEILETGSGQAVDELVVRLPDATLLDLLVDEVRQVDGVAVEQIRHLPGTGHDTRLATLELTARLVEAPDREELVTTCCELGAASLSAVWVAVVDRRDGRAVGRGGDAPADEWLAAFVHGAASAASLGGADAGSSDVIWSATPGADLAVVAGRDRIAWRERERAQLDALGRVLASRWLELAPR